MLHSCRGVAWLTLNRCWRQTLEQLVPVQQHFWPTCLTSGISAHHDHHVCPSSHLSPAWFHNPPQLSSTGIQPSNAWSLALVTHARSVFSYSRATGQPRPRPWPVLERINPSNGESSVLKWHRTVLRAPPEVQINRHDNIMILSGKAGSVKLNLTRLDPTGLAAFTLLQLPSSTGSPDNIGTSDSGSAGGAAGTSTPASHEPAPGTSSSGCRWTLLIASPCEKRFRRVVATLRSAFQGVSQGYLVGLTVKGVGYRIEPADEAAVLGAGRKVFAEPATNDKLNIQYPYKNPVGTLRLRVGASRPTIYTLPGNIRAFCVKPTVMYLYGLEKDKLDAVAREIRSMRKPNKYTGNGILYVGEVVKLKPKSSKAKMR